MFVRQCRKGKEAGSGRRTVTAAHPLFFSMTAHEQILRSVDCVDCCIDCVCAVFVRTSHSSNVCAYFESVELCGRCHVFASSFVVLLFPPQLRSSAHIRCSRALRLAITVTITAGVPTPHIVCIRLRFVRKELLFALT